MLPITERDYFAVVALSGVLANELIIMAAYEMKRAWVEQGKTPMEFEETIEFPMYANVSYRIADAMIKEKNKDK